ncbi:MAG TPA: alpha-glucan phosphorylase [Anaerolineaceae bacterium]|nr:MAG: Phosphorylase [Anaerolineae bacterium 49_20]HAE85929.1 alpha-glucan phosphorylase [Anaerolineaceae bacterium]
MEKIIREIPNTFDLPYRIKKLADLAHNLWWAWNPEAARMIKEIDPLLWERSHHNPVVFLRSVDPATYETLIKDRYFLGRYDRIMREFNAYMKPVDTWFSRAYPNLLDDEIAYFSFEYGLHESLMVYAGGLGVLSGDHLKESSDLGMPLVGVGFLYTYGYFSQRITEDGWQEARNVQIVYDDLPLIALYDENREPIKISVELPGRTVYARLYELNVGRVKLVLMQTNIPENNPNDRQLTDRLYTSDPELRISQEILLGIGGFRALKALGHNPSIYHMNEGHSAFLTLERTRELVRQGKTFDEAIDLVKRSSVFTTHTPVPAGNDEFPIWMVEKYFANLWPQLGLNREQFMDIARIKQDWGGEAFSMPKLALKLSNFRNGVSKIHGQVSKQMWHELWPDKPVDEVPITYITNGVHTRTWLARRLAILYRRYLGADWYDHIDDEEMWQRVDLIPDADLWRVRRHLKRKLVAYMVNRARDAWQAGSVHPVQTVASGVLLDPYALTIGFARRFATYKRANLVLTDVDRLLRIVTNPRKPVQIVFAGKAHPSDEPAKLLIQEVYRHVKDARFGGRLVFLDDYDMDMARYLVQGVDVWLNTPRRPREASGTSGQKAALNGTLNFSVLDGWWAEGYNGANGWAIGDSTVSDNQDEQDKADAESLYDTLENEIVPLYYTMRSADGLPGDWIERMKESIKTLTPRFSTTRMVKQYMNELYLPAIQSMEKESVQEKA